MEIRQFTQDKMWFKIVGKHIKFSIEEFALVIGHEDDNTNMYNIGYGQINHMFFKHQKRKDIENTFNSLNVATTNNDVEVRDSILDFEFLIHIDEWVCCSR